MKLNKDKILNFFDLWREMDAVATYSFNAQRLSSELVGLKDLNWFYALYISEIKISIRNIRIK